MKLDFLLNTGGGGGGHSGGEGSAAKPTPPITPRHDPVPLALDDARPIIRTGVATVALFAALFGGFALLAPISGASVSAGEVMTSGTPAIIQPETGGVVGQIFVSEGQAVKAGQPLLRLNGVRSAAAAQQAQAKRDALRATQARLIAERDGAASISFPADLVARGTDPAVQSAMTGEQAIFARHRAVMDADRRIAQTQQGTAQAQRTAARRQLALIRDELGSVQTLYEKGFARKSQVRALQRAAAQLEAETATGGDEVARSGLQSARLANDQMMQTVAQLSQIEQQLAQTEPALRVTRYDENRDLLRAPVAGHVSGLARVGPGSVLGGGQTVLEVVPSDRTLIVETQIAPSEVDNVRTGLKATLNFTSVHPSGRSTFDGHVIALSPNRIETDKGAHFRALIAVDDAKAIRSAGVAIQPGLPVSVQIKTKDRTLFDYLFSPLIDTMRTGFREE